MLVLVLVLGEVTVALFEDAVDLAEVVLGEQLEFVQAPTTKIITQRPGSRRFRWSAVFRAAKVPTHINKYVP